jgi:hypothetical protein
MGRKMEVIQRRPGISGVLGDKIRDESWPLTFWDGPTPSPVTIQGLDGVVARHAEAAVALPEVPFILPEVGEPGSHQIAGAAAARQISHGLGRRVDRLEDPLIVARRQVCHDPGW